MGHLNKKIEQLANELFNNYCVGNRQFLNKKAIKACISQTISQFVTNKYQQHVDTEESFVSIITSKVELTDLASQLQYPLLIVKPSLVGEKYGIDLSSHDQDYHMIEDLRKFFNKSHKMIGNNCKRFAKKRIRLDEEDDPEAQLSNEEIIQIVTDGIEIEI